MRIGICCYPTHGGSGVVATELGKHLAERGHEVSFVSYDTPLRLSDLPPRVSYHEIEIEQYPLLKHFPYTLALASKLAEVVRMKNLDILHAHYAIPFGAAALLARQIVAPEKQLKVVTTLHGTDITLVGNNASFKPVTKLAIEDADAVTVVSQFLRDETARQFGTQRELHVIYNFVDPDRHGVGHCPCMRAHCCPSRKTIMHISNFRPVKRLRDVVRIFARINETVPSCLILVGDGPDAPVAVETAAELGVSERLHFIGVVDDVAPLLRSADLLLLPSSTESFGLVALEAMASGVPVVASAVGGLPEVVVQGECGYLAPVGDIEQMARYGASILQDEALRTRLGSAGRKRARERFHYRLIVPQYESLYRSLVEPSA
jgi:N-acetyl-alpha-D-glucosaminyl L-malate synthase BshA